MIFNEEHLAKLKSIRSFRQEGFGSHPCEWMESVIGEEAKSDTFASIREGYGANSKKRLNRDEVREFCGRSEECPLAKFAVCMAWGGMRRSNGRRAWKEKDRIRNLIRILEQSKQNREEAYRCFWDARIAGLGPAYFTKLIYFIGRENDEKRRGYIMDQWTAKSVNLLFPCDEKMITLRSDWVSHACNTPDVYEAYCQKISRLASELGLNESDAELAIFSSGGRGDKKGEWRKYVQECYRHGGHH